MELSEQEPDKSEWRFLVQDIHTIRDDGGNIIPNVTRSVYRYREESDDSDRYSYAQYFLDGTLILSVWGTVGSAGCCKFHKIANHEKTLTGPPTLVLNTENSTLFIDGYPFSLFR